MGLESSEEFEMNYVVHQESVLYLLLLAIVTDLVIESARKGLIMDKPYAHGHVLMHEMKEELTEKFWKW